MEKKNEIHGNVSQPLLDSYSQLKEKYAAFRSKLEKFIKETPELFYNIFPSAFDHNRIAGLKISVKTLQEQIIHFLNSFREIEANQENLKKFGIDQEDYLKLIISVNSFCLHMLYSFFNISNDQYPVFVQLCFKLYAIYKQHDTHVHSNIDNEKLMLLWFRHHFNHIYNKIKYNKSLSLTALIKEHECFLDTYKKFCERACHISKIELLINQIAIYTDQTLEEYYCANDTSLYYNSLIEMYYTALKEDSQKNPLTTEIKNYLLSGLFQAQLKKDIYVESSSEYNKITKTSSTQVQISDIMTKMFQNTKYFKKMIKDVQLTHKKYDIDKVMDYISVLNPTQRKLLDNPLMFGGITLNNLTTELIWQAENALKLILGMQFIAVKTYCLDSPPERKTEDEIIFNIDLLTFEIKCLQHKIILCDVQRLYPEYYDENEAKIRKAALEERKLESEKLLKVMEEKKAIILQASTAAAELIDECEKSKNQNNKNNTKNKKKKDKKNKRKAILNEARRIIEEAKLAAQSAHHEDALKGYLHALKLLNKNQDEYLICLQGIEQCFQLISIETKEKPFTEKDLATAKEYFQLILQSIGKESIETSVKENASLNSQIHDAIKRINLQLANFQESLKQLSPTIFCLQKHNPDHHIRDYHIPLNEFEKNIFKILREKGYFVFLLGGRVKDHLTQKIHNDTDIIVFNLKQKPQNNEKSISLHDLLSQEKLDLHSIISKEYAVIRLSNNKSWPIDIHDISKKISSYAINWQENPQNVIYEILRLYAKQRGFTIDAIFYDPFNCKLIDPLDGETDLKNKKLVIVNSENNASILLRGIRFITKYDLSVPDKLLNYEENLNALNKCDKENLYLEINKQFFNGLATKNFELLTKLNLFATIFPSTHRSMEQSPVFNNMIKQLFCDMDSLCQQKVPLSAAYVYSIFLWGPLSEKLNEKYTFEEFNQYFDKVLQQIGLVTISSTLIPRIKTILLINFFSLETLQEKQKEFSYKISDVRLAKQLENFYYNITLGLQTRPSNST